MLAKEPSGCEVVNDLNGDLVNLYRYAQFHLDPLIQEVQWTLTSRADMTDLVNDCPANRALFAGHEMTPIVTRAQCANQRTQAGKTFGEIIIRRRVSRPVRKSARDAHKLPLAA